ncbi:MAG TPA: hypothetical protein VFU02_17905 [Polyangiaceae bacterium]|nr:hypothetical protein [Polyangiaceae bacterium]
MLSLILLGSAPVAMSCRDEHQEPHNEDVGGSGGHAGASETTEGHITGDSVAAGNFLREYAAAVCVMYRPCCVDEGQGYDSAGCTEGVYEFFRLQSEGTFSPEAAAHCLAAFGDARAQDPDRCKTVPSFDAAVLRSECRAAFVPAPRIGMPLGGECALAANCASSSLGPVTCFEERCLVQRPGAADEGPCQLSSALVAAEATEVFTCSSKDGLYCNLTTNTCAELGGPGDTCPHSGSCEDGSMCLLQKCTRLPQRGEACLSTIPGLCAPGSACDEAESVCGPPLEQGDPCRRPEQCTSGRCRDGHCEEPEFLSRLSCTGEG